MKWRAVLCVCACLAGGVAARPILDASHDWAGGTDDAYITPTTTPPLVGDSTTVPGETTVTTAPPETSAGLLPTTIPGASSTAGPIPSLTIPTIPPLTSPSIPEPTLPPPLACPPCPIGYSVLAATTVTNTGPTTAGSVGLWPGTAVTGFPPGDAVIDTSPAALAAQTELTAAYLAAFLRPSTTVNAQLGGQVLGPGVYAGPVRMSLDLTGTLVLDGAGTYIFQTDSTLITASGSRVELVNGARACDITWQVGSSATLGTGSSFAGTIMALTSITVTTDVDVRGRVLARNGAVTLDSDTFTGC